jgi:MFS family permease
MTASAPKKRHIAAAVVGNALEFYDFTTYGYFALQIGHTFFPSRDPFLSLMATLVTFGVGFIMRPVGGIVIGRYADRIGRRPAMVLCFAAMGAGVLALALTPSYASIGIAAPIIVVLIRLVQGFALGGDVGPTTAFMLEAAAPEQRGLYGSMQFASQGLATLAAGTAGVVLSSFLDAGQLQHFGWRIALGLGVLVVPIGLLMRRSIPETLHDAVQRDDTVYRTGPWRIVTLGLLLIMGSTTSVYVLNYMATYAQDRLHLSATVAFTSILTFGVVSVIVPPLSGRVSDRVGRLPVMIWPRVLLVLAAYPAFVAITWWPGVLSLTLATALIAFLSPAQHRNGGHLRHWRRGVRRHDPTHHRMAHACDRIEHRAGVLADGDIDHRAGRHIADERDGTGQSEAGGLVACQTVKRSRFICDPGPILVAIGEVPPLFVIAGETFFDHQPVQQAAIGACFLV